MLAIRVRCIKENKQNPVMWYSVEDAIFWHEYEKEAKDKFKELKETLPYRKDLLSGDYSLQMKHVIVKDSQAEYEDDTMIEKFDFRVENDNL